MADMPLAKRVEVLEEKVGVLELLPARIDRLEVVLRDEIRTGDEETRRLMRVLHEDLVERIKTVGEAIDFIKQAHGVD